MCPSHPLDSPEIFLIKITGAPTLTDNTLHATILCNRSTFPVSKDLKYFGGPGISSSNFSWFINSTSKFVPNKYWISLLGIFCNGLSRLFTNSSVSSVGLPSHNSLITLIN